MCVNAKRLSVAVLGVMATLGYPAARADAGCDESGVFTIDNTGCGESGVFTIDNTGEPPGPEDPPIRKNRYISFDPNNPDISVAFQVEMTGSTYFPGSVGILGWVGEPFEAPEDPGVWLAELVDAQPAGRIWSEPLVHLGDCKIVPVATYQIRATVDGIVFSDPLVISTIAQPTPQYWADCVGQMEAGSWTAPNGVVNFDDVSAAVQYFTSAATAPHLTMVDIEPEEPNAVLNFSDIQQIVYAFQGDGYPFSDPADCTLTPRLDGYSNGGCQEPPGGRSRDGYPFCGDDVFQFNVDGHTLHAVHEHAAYNCCLADIQVTLSLVENTIRLAEEETFDGDPCLCLCC
ncbi:MAG: hypothetical protein KJ749_07195 [Planctomycetes bacterium]|nr:hypothetical protein [Planctomycetota bacterium]